jgi:ubiquinone/menaquinone biosynthesis C-methylase UbiE
MSEHDRPTTAPPDRVAAAVRAEYARLAPEYDRRWAGYVAASVGATLTRLALRPGERLLDVGCGTGTLLAAALRAAPGARVAGADLAPEMLAAARAKLGPEVPLAAADATRLPFRTGSFDAVASSSSLHYWSDAPAGVAECARVLRPGGRLVITDWCHDYLTCKALDLVLRARDPAHRRTYGSRACAALLADAGFAGVAVERYKISWLWGLMTAGAARPSGAPAEG